mgnify:CR=1 FL=1
MSRLDFRYRSILLPYISDIRLPGNRIDLNACEEVLAAHGLRNLSRAARVASGLRFGKS